MRSALLALVLLSPGPGDPPDAALREFDALVRAFDRGWYQEPVGPSPTLLRARLLRRGEPAVRETARRAWEKASVFGTRAYRQRDSIETAIRHLFPRPGKEGVGTGALLISAGPAGGGGPTPREGTPLPPFDELVEGCSLREVPPASAATLLGLLVRLSKEPVPGDAYDAMRGIGSRRICVAMALGEASAGDTDAERILLERCRLFPEDPAVIDAAGWCVVPATREYLRKRLREPAPSPLLARVCGALAHHGPGALEEAFEALPEEARERVLGSLEFGSASALRMAGIRAGTPEAREGLLRSLEKAKEGRTLDPKYLPDFVAMVGTMLDSPDPGTRERGRGAVRRMFNSCFGAGLHSMSGCNGTDVFTTGAELGPYPSEEGFLRALAEDLAAGRLRIADAPPGLCDPDPPEVLPPEVLPATDDPCPEPFIACESGGSPVHLAAAWTEAGVRVEIRNVGAGPFAVSPVTLRHALGERATITIREKGTPGRSFRELTVDPGHLGFFFDAGERCLVSASTLVVLRRGETFAWTIPVRPADRVVDWLLLQGDGRLLPLDGDPGMPVLRTFGSVYVRIARP